MLRSFAIRPLSKNIAPFAAVWLVAAAAAIGSLVWSVSEVNRISRQRDQSLALVVMQQSMNDVAHTQESSTYWDDAIRKIASKTLDLEWIDANMGVWFNQYAGHDEVYIVDGAGEPIYAMLEGRRAAPQAYRLIEPTVAPLVAKLRNTTEIASPLDLDVAMMTPGVTDLAVIHGQPSIVSVEPFASDTGELDGHPETRAVHISVLHLGERFLNGIARQYGFKDARISTSPPEGTGEHHLSLRDHKGTVIGYLMWRPFEPGADVLGMVAPFLLAVLFVLGAMILVQARRVQSKSRSLERSEAQAKYRAYHDGLTGLRNRAMFEMNLPALLEQSGRDGGSLALLYIDIDHFKQVNDRLGHATGDLLIRAVGRRLSEEVRAQDAVYRLGGDEFAVILCNPGSVELVERICDRMVHRIGQPFDLSGALVHVGASVGVALSPENAANQSDLTRKADIALYRAKAGGRGRHAFFRPEMDEAIARRADFDREMRLAMEPEGCQLEVVYQPIFSARSGAIVAVEALLRWHHPQRGLLTPAVFGHLAEESGLISAIGEWVLTTAARDAAQWPDVRLAVNVSPLQLRDRGFADRVASILAAGGLAPERLELELTESSLLDHSNRISATIGKLRAAGISIALDDFGTGFSSLSHIRDIAVDRIKIDRSFIAATNTAPGLSLVHGIVTMANGYGLQVTAEGVETGQQGDLIRSLGCDEAQGYFYSRPLSAANLASLLQAGRKDRETIAA